MCFFIFYFLPLCIKLLIHTRDVPELFSECHPRVVFVMQMCDEYDSSRVV